MLLRQFLSSTLGLLVLGASPLGLVSSLQAQTKWDMPTPYPDANFHTQNVRSFVEEVKKATKGQLEIIVHSNASLIKNTDILRGVQTGQVNIGETFLSQFGNEDPFFEADSIPFLATGFDNAWKLFQAHKPFVEKRMLTRGVRVLYSVPWPGQGIFTKSPINSIQDLKGVKFRTHNPMTARMAELVGAVPTTVQAAEVPQAFATNIVTAMITSTATGVDSKAWEFAKYYYNFSAFHPRNVVIANERAFRRLPEDIRNAVMQAAVNAEKRGWDSARERDAASLKTLADNGVTVVKPDAALTAAFNDVGKTILSEWTKKAKSDGEALVQNYRKQ